MRILLLNPWIADENLIAYEKEFVPADVDVEGLKEGPLGQCRSDMARNLPALIDTVVDAENKGYDAVVIACFGDTGIEILRELVKIPVLGPGNVCLHVALMLGHKVCMLHPEYEHIGGISRENIELYGLHDRVVVRGSSRSVPDAIQSYQEYIEKGTISPFISEMTDLCVKSIRDDDADIIVLGCGGVMWMKKVLESELGKRGYRITVMNPIPVAVEMARMLVKLNLSHSEVGYPSPPDMSERKHHGFVGCK
jgi:allantoin racemase